MDFGPMDNVFGPTDDVFGPMDGVSKTTIVPVKWFKGTVYVIGVSTPIHVP